MGGQFPERVALGLTTEMLEELRLEAKRHGRTVLAQIRFFCEEGIKLAKKTDAIEDRLEHLEQRLTIAEDLLPYSKPRAPAKQKTSGRS